MSEELCARLRAMYSHRGDGIPTQYVNPDGPEAADEIERFTRAAPSVQDLAAARDAAIEECARVAAQIIDPPAFSGRDKKSDAWRRTHALKKGAAIAAALRATPAPESDT